MRLVYLALVLTLLVTGCSFQIPTELFATRKSTSEPTVMPLPVPTQTPALFETVTPTGPLTLQIWLPPQFDPDSGTPAANLLKARLDEFSSRMPEVKIDVRIKAIEGPGGLLDTLSTASKAAQLALPDLVIIPHDSLELAVQQGLLNSFDNLSSSLDDPDWFNFAREMARFQNNTYGLPFAADALVQVYRPEKIPEPALFTDAVLTNQSPFIFTAADPRALFPLALYQASGGAIYDEKGQVSLNAEILEDVLTFFQQANQTESMPFWLTGYQRDEQSWESFQENRGDQVITWLSRYLTNTKNENSLAPIPTPKGPISTLGNGWMWALTSPDPSHHPASVKLAEFLTESNFLARWTEASGYLPPRPSALLSWKDQAIAAQLSPIAQTIHPSPPFEILTRLGSVLEKATVSILKQQAEPAEAAQQAVEGLE